MDNRLFTMFQENIHTGDRRVIYGHATHNVMDDYWRAYVDANHRVVIGLWHEEEWNKEHRQAL